MMNVEDAVAAVPLGEDDFVFSVGCEGPAPVYGGEELPEINVFGTFSWDEAPRASRCAPPKTSELFNITLAWG